MTEQEAMEILKKPCLCDYDLSKTIFDCDIEQCDKRDAVLQAIKALEEICQYREIGTPEECRAAVEKQKAKKPVRATSTKKDGKVGKCPCCGSIIGEDMIWCDDCGQRILWEV